MNEDNIDDVETLIAAAQARFRQKDFVAAVEEFKTVCRLRPNAHFADRYAHCYSALGQWPQAREAWSQAIENHGNSVGRVNQLARCFIELQDYAAAGALLTSSREQIDANANFFVFATIASVGTGDLRKALDCAQHVERLAVEEKVPAINFLGGLLDRLGRNGHAENVLRLLDLLLPSLIDRKRFLRIGIGISTVLRRWETKLSYACEMIRLEPNASEGYCHQMQALLEVGRFDECQRLIIEVNQLFPESVRIPEDDKLISGVELQLSSWVTWKRLLCTAGEAQTFHALNFRAAAHMTLKQHEQAIEVASTGVKLHNGHPWFVVLLGRCHETLGNLDAALYWFTKATKIDPERTDYLLYLCQAQLRAGLRDAAFLTANKLIHRHPNIPVIKSLFGKLGGDPNDHSKGNVKHSSHSTLSHRTWLHGGDSGDVIYALAAMQAGGGGHLYLTCIEGTREPMEDSKIGFLIPLLTVQHYVEGVGTWQGEPIEKDFIVFRHLMFPDTDLATQHWRCVIDDLEPDVKTSWLTVPAAAKHGRPVFARSHRYRNRNWNAFWKELKASSPDALFVGTAAEFDDFGHGEHHLAQNALDLANVIAGATVFIGNQSLPYAIAEGLKVGRLLEVSAFVPNCIFPGALALGFHRTAESAP